MSEAMATLASLLSPFAPHLADELADRLGLLAESPSLFRSAWPKADERVAAEEQVTIVVQVNGKVRDRLVVAADTPEDRVRELAQASPRIRKHLEGKTVRRVIFVPGRLVNIVVG